MAVLRAHSWLCPKGSGGGRLGDRMGFPGSAVCKAGGPTYCAVLWSLILVFEGFILHFVSYFYQKGRINN